MVPAIRIKMELTVVSRVELSGSLILPNKPRLNMSSSAPKIIPLIPASESIRFVACE
jgi:hypothetical protein